MALAKNHFMEETQIRDLLDGWAQAFQARDLDRLMSHYTDDVVVFDLMPPLRYEGKEAYRKLWEETLPSMGEDTRIELADQHVVVDEEVAFCHGLCRFQGTDADGRQVDIWSRMTEGLRKADGRWLICHEHFSNPIDMATGKGLMDLKP
jgi:uncharacterized protein (TIGR02246 family)